MNDPNPVVEIISVDHENLDNRSLQTSSNRNISFRDSKVIEHYGGVDKSLKSRFANSSYNGEQLLKSLVDEYLREIDNLAANSQIAVEGKDFAAATIISIKRSEVIEKAIKAIMHKKEFEAENSIDVDSPSMEIVFRYFLKKCQEAFELSGFKADISNTFFQSLGTVIKDWRKDLKKQISEMKSL